MEFENHSLTEKIELKSKLEDEGLEEKESSDKGFKTGFSPLLPYYKNVRCCGHTELVFSCIM
jgi:hypothetical protein